MTSKPGDEPYSNNNHLSPTQEDPSNLDDVSDVESFSRTRPDVEDDDDDLESPELEEDDSQVIQPDNDATPRIGGQSTPPEREMSTHVKLHDTHDEPFI